MGSQFPVAVSNFEKEISSKSESLLYYQKQCSVKSETIYHLETENQQKLKKLNDFTSIIERWERTNKDTLKKQQEVENKMEVIENERDELVEQLKESEEKHEVGINNLETEIQELQGQVKETESKHKTDIDAKLKEAENDVIELSIKVESLQSSLSLEETKLKGKEVELNYLKTKSDHEIEKKNSLIENQKKHLIIKNDKMTKLESDISKLKVDYENEKTCVNQLESRLKIQSDSIAEIKRNYSVELNSKEENIKELETRVKKQSESIANLQESLDEKKITISELTTVSKTIEQQQGKKELQMKLDELSEELKQKEDLLAQLSFKEQSADVTLEELSQDLAIKTADNETIRTSLSHHKSELTRVLKEKVLLEKALVDKEKYSDDINVKKEELVRKYE